MKIINIKVIPNAKENSVFEENEILKVRVKAPAIDNKANKAVIKILADYLGLKKNKIEIIRGEKLRKKIVKLCD
ncbi:MAG: DUF167 domain-containing protein [Patescibacteria group bacterium]